MIYAHFGMNMEEARFLFKSFIDQRKDKVVKAEKKTTFYTVKLLDGNEHCFMSFTNYKKWNIGRTYMMYGRLYHSGMPYVGSEVEE